MNRKRRIILIAFAAVVLALGCAGAVLAAQGSESDPLVSLSYLTQKYTPEVLAQVDERIAASSAALLTQMQGEVSALRAEVEKQLAAIEETEDAGTQEPAAGFTLVTLTNGQTLHLAVGGEALLRVGTAVCTADSAPGLIDLTDAGSINSGAALVKNHLYMATIENRGVAATAATVKLLVRGSYTVE